MTTVARGESLVLSAAAFAAEKHAGQVRKGDGTAYINHPLRVAEILQGVGADEEVLAAAILHDVLEDTNAKYYQLRVKFGENVAKLVVQVTDDKTKSKYNRKLSQIKKAQQGLMDPKAMLIKIADKIDNTRDLAKTPPKDWSKDDQIGYCAWSCKVVTECLHTAQKLDYNLQNEMLFLYEKFVEATQSFLNYDDEKSIDEAYKKYMQGLPGSDATSSAIIAPTPSQFDDEPIGILAWGSLK